MDIITRNFFRLLRAGVFGEKEEIEPMSAWKWRQLYQYSMMHGISALLYDGVEQCDNQFYLQLPEDLRENWKKSTLEVEQKNVRERAILSELYDTLSQQLLRPILLKGQRFAILYPKPYHRLSVKIDIFFPFKTQGEKADRWAHEHGNYFNEPEKNLLTYVWRNTTINHSHQLIHLTNGLLNHQLQIIIEQEIRESKANLLYLSNKPIECLSPTLEILYILVSIARRILCNGIPIKLFVDLGVLLRTIGDRVDFVKLQGWITKLHMKRIAHLSATMLITLLHFSEDELPFLIPERKGDLSHVLNELFEIGNVNQSEWFYQQGKDILVHTAKSPAIMWQVKHSSRHFKYYPSEGFTNLFSTFARSLIQIEE